MNILQLPYEIGIQIGKFLKVRDLSNLTISNTHFSHLCKDEQLFYELYYRDFLSYAYPLTKKEQIKEQEESRKRGAGWNWKELYIILWQTTERMKCQIKNFYGLIQKTEVPQYPNSLPYSIYHIHEDDEDDIINNFTTCMARRIIIYKMWGKKAKFGPDKLRSIPIEIEDLDVKNKVLKTEMRIRGHYINANIKNDTDPVIESQALIGEGFVKWSSVRKQFLSMYPMDGLRSIFNSYVEKYEDKAFLMNDKAKEFMNREYTFKIGTPGNQFNISIDEINRILNNSLKKYELEVIHFDDKKFEVTCRRKPEWKIPENRCLDPDCLNIATHKNFCSKHNHLSHHDYYAKQFRAMRNKERHAEYIAYYRRISSCSSSSSGSTLGGVSGSSLGFKVKVAGDSGVRSNVGSERGLERSIDGIPASIKVDIKGKVNGFLLTMVTH